MFEVSGWINQSVGIRFFFLFADEEHVKVKTAVKGNLSWKSSCLKLTTAAALVIRLLTPCSSYYPGITFVMSPSLSSQWFLLQNPLFLFHDPEVKTVLTFHSVLFTCSFSLSSNIFFYLDNLEYCCQSLFSVLNKRPPVHLTLLIKKPVCSLFIAVDSREI